MVLPQDVRARTGPALAVLTLAGLAQMLQSLALAVPTQAVLALEVQPLVVWALVVLTLAVLSQVVQAQAVQPQVVRS